MSAARILIVDDEPDIRELIGEILSEEGHEVALAGSGSEARERRGQFEPELILLDVWMPDIDGISLLNEWRQSGSLDCPVVMISGHGSVEAAVQATRLGAFDFIEKPLSLAKLLVTIENALESRRLKLENVGLKRQMPAIHDPLGRSLIAQTLRERLERIASHDGQVLITGETGVGKEEAARWIHARSRRADQPFMVASTRLEPSALHQLLVGGGKQPGLLAQGQGGVLYLDDVARLSAAGQAVLLQALETMLRPDDALRRASPHVRVIAATTVALDRSVRAGQFDEALYYLLNVLPLEIPPLRQRPEDIPDLVRFYAEHFPGQQGLPYRHFPVAVQNRLRQHNWPGNLHELKNLIQRLLVLGGGDEVSVGEVEAALAQSVLDVQPVVNQSPPLFNLPLREAREEFERQYLTFRLKHCDGSVGRLAESVEMERTHLYRKLRQLGIDPKQLSRED